MKGPVKPNRLVKAKRDLFVELREGIKALAEARLGKIKLRSHSVKLPNGSQEILSRSSRDSMKAPRSTKYSKN